MRAASESSGQPRGSIQAPQRAGPITHLVQAAALALWGCALLGIVALVWIGWQPRPNRPFPRAYRDGGGVLGGFRGMGSYPIGPSFSMRSQYGFYGRDPSGWYSVRMLPQPEPRYVANLADRVGDYCVSVRQVVAGDDRLTLYQNVPPTAPRRPLGGLVVSVQVMAARQEALGRIREFTRHLTATDDTGQRLTTQDVSPVVAFPRGLARLVHLSAPAPRARFLVSLEGDLRLVGSGARPLHPLARLAGASGFRPDGERRAPARDHQAGEPPVRVVPFHCAAVPLPGAHHLFGLAAARFLPPAMAAGLKAETDASQGVRVLTGRQIKALRRLFPPYTREPGPFALPTRLILVPDVANSFLLSAPALSNRTRTPVRLACRLTPHSGPDGEIRLQLTVPRAGGLIPLARADLRAWDNAPLILILPARGGAGQISAQPPLALLLHLYLDMPPTNSISLDAESLPFKASREERGGAITGAAQAGRQPLGLGTARVKISRTDGQAASSETPVVTQAALDQEGRWRLGNLSPGRYLVQLLEVNPYISPATVPTSPWNYLRRRFGVTQHAWQHATQDNVIVRAGGEASLLPWQAQ